MTPELVTPRLVLRPFAAADGDDLYAMDCDDRVMRYLATGLRGRTREQSDQALARIIAFAAGKPGYGLLHARRRDDDAFVGGCGLYPLPDTDDIEIAYRLPHACWGQRLCDRDGAGRRRVRPPRPRARAHRRRHVSGERGFAARAAQDRHARGGHGDPLRAHDERVRGPARGRLMRASAARRGNRR